MQGSGAFTGTRATYVALSAVTVLVLALITSIWHSDVSGSIAVLGLLSIYMSSTELLILFLALSPVSILIDIFRLSGDNYQYRGRGWLIFFSVAALPCPAVCLMAEILAKVAGTVFAWSLHRSITTGDGGALLAGEGGNYHPIAPPAAGIRPGNGMTTGGSWPSTASLGVSGVCRRGCTSRPGVCMCVVCVGADPTGFRPAGASPTDDPFAAYAPPRNAGAREIGQVLNAVSTCGSTLDKMRWRRRHGCGA
ncbi:hypothetical protein QJQ45_030188 [Haematococcus lacustris]|nr:hypothetical protein QJQ45_030188 [Haematococcus lacustris]